MYRIPQHVIEAAQTLLPETIEILAANASTNELGEPVPGWTVTGVTIGRLGVPAPRTPVVAGAVLDVDELVLTIPLSQSANGDAFRINGDAIVERRGPDINGLTTFRVVRRIPVRRTELTAVVVED